jgi:hypothetical protein
MAAPLPPSDGIGIANLPNQVCFFLSYVHLVFTQPNFNRDTRLSPNVVLILRSWLLVSRRMPQVHSRFS